jgi:hypothetical protein
MGRSADAHFLGSRDTFRNSLNCMKIPKKVHFLVRSAHLLRRFVATSKCAPAASTALIAVAAPTMQQTPAPIRSSRPCSRASCRNLSKQLAQAFVLKVVVRCRARRLHHCGLVGACRRGVHDLARGRLSHAWAPVRTRRSAVFSSHSKRFSGPQILSMAPPRLRQSTSAPSVGALRRHRQCRRCGSGGQELQRSCMLPPAATRQPRRDSMRSEVFGHA